MQIRKFFIVIRFGILFSCYQLQFLKDASFVFPFRHSLLSNFIISFLFPGKISFPQHVVFVVNILVKNYFPILAFTGKIADKQRNFISYRYEMFFLVFKPFCNRVSFGKRTIAQRPYIKTIVFKNIIGFYILTNPQNKDLLLHSSHSAN